VGFRTLCVENNVVAFVSKYFPFADMTHWQHHHIGWYISMRMIWLSSM